VSGEAPWSAKLSGTPLADEYRAQEGALRRGLPVSATFEAGRYRPETLAKLRALWSARMQSEYESTAVFTDIAQQLMEAGASLDAQAVVLRMAHDELRHADLAARAVETFGGEATMTPRPPAPASRADRCTPEERALRSVIYGCCLGETINAARFVDALETTRDPYVRELLRQLLADERMHAQFGYYYLEAWRPWLEGHPEIRARLARYLTYAFAVLERDLSGVRHTSTPAPALDDEERAVGLPDLPRLPRTFYATVEGAIVPGLDRFELGAASAWAERRLRSADAAPAG
jgi:hypothetical protein